MWVVMAIRLLWLREGREIFLPQAITLQGKGTYRVSRAVASIKRGNCLVLILAFFLRNFSSLRRLKTWSRTSMANKRLNGLASGYIHKPTEIDSSSVLKKMGCLWPQTYCLSFQTGKKLSLFQLLREKPLLLLIVKVSDFLVLQV